MQTVRTTITLPESIYEELREDAYKNKQSLNSVMVERITKVRNRKKSNAQIVREMRKLAKNFNTKGINYKELVEDGRKY